MSFMRRFENFCGSFFEKSHVYNEIRLRRKKFTADVKDHSVLSPEEKAAVKEYWKKYIPRPSTCFHEFIKEVNGDFDVRYLPEDAYFCYVDAYFNNVKEAAYLDNKCYYRYLFPDVKQPEMIVERAGRFWYMDGRIVSFDEARAAVLSSGGCFAKIASGSYGGGGVRYVTEETIDEFDKLAASASDIVVQKPIRQHEYMKRFGPTSVNTVRVMSMLTEEGVKIIGCSLRCGLAGKRVDNTSSGGFAVGIRPDGSLRTTAHFKDGRKLTAHPDTGAVFEGSRIPAFDDIISTVKREHIHLPHFRLVSWDMTLDETGTPMLIEANLCRGGASVIQYNNGPLFGDDTEKILKEVFGK